ncbi:hypothetical protein [Sediminicoccus sp. KRV36]|uniref:hypothetical protein n=1 Tax=Sediminicoccus sp. KRV36 TaxID=3133721 RepID=UPI00200CDDCE|nr:hypothetical protein [Sediminicoccus rosea]UPY38445.1 hypothetical protein LHU95_07050 [Sediminicoccus rosea]
MTTRRLLIAAATTASAATLAQAQPAQAQPAQAQTAPAAGMAEFLFVQTARRMSFDRASNRLTLHEVSPITIMFADRPDRIAGHMQTAAFVPFWSRGSDSFLKDPPNADISIVEGDTLRQVVVVLRDPVLEGDALRYTVRVLEGAMPETGGAVSVFIDIIGMPRTPMSFAGAARRRAFIR